MNQKSSITLTMLLGLVCTLIVASISQAADAQKPKGHYVSNSDFLGMYGKYSYETLTNKKFSDIVDIIKKAKPNFKVKDVGTSFPSTVFEFDDGGLYLILSGCTPHNCGDTVNVIAYDLGSANKAYVLAEEQNQEFKIYGNPSEEVRNLLVYHHMKYCLNSGKS